MLFKTLAYAFPLLALALPVSAAQPQLLGQYDAWGAYSYRTGTTTTCYVLAVPTDSSPKNVDHGQNFFLVSRMAGQEVPQAAMGYALKPGSQIHVTVGSSTFDMFVKDDRGWVEDAEQEPALVRAMRGSQTMAVDAISQRGTATHYSYSLSGITAALQRTRLCK